MKLKPPIGARLDRDHPLADGLALAYLFNEGGGSTVFDASGHGNHGTLTNMDPATDWVPDEGGALDFDGGNDYADTGYKGYASQLGFTFAIRLNVAAIAPSKYFLDASNGAQGFALRTYTSPDRIDAFIYRNAGANEVQISYDSTGEHFFVYGGDGLGTDTLYDNGLVIGTSVRAGALPASATYSLHIMSEGDGTDSAAGIVSGCWVWHRALAASEVAALYEDPYAAWRPRRRTWFVPSGAPATGGGRLTSGLLIGGGRLIGGRLVA